MTEESMSEEDAEVVRKHKLPWHSDGKALIIVCLGLLLISTGLHMDRRAAKSDSKAKSAGGFSSDHCIPPETQETKK